MKKQSYTSGTLLLWLLSVLVFASCHGGTPDNELDSNSERTSSQGIVDPQVAKLINDLQDPDLDVRIRAANDLADAGPAARTAVPALIEAMETAPSCTHPEDPAAILIQSRHVVIGEAVRVVRIVAIGHKHTRSAVHHIEPGRGADPEPSLFIFEQGRHLCTAQAGCLFGVVAKVGEGVRGAVEPV